MFALSLASYFILLRKSEMAKMKYKSEYWKFLCKKASKMRAQPTAAESIFSKKLEELRIKYVFQHLFSMNLNKRKEKQARSRKKRRKPTPAFGGLGGIADFYLPSRKMVIEIDGGYHLDPEQQQTDAIKDFMYEKLRYNILRLTNDQAIHLPTEQIGVLIKKANKPIKTRRDIRDAEKLAFNENCKRKARNRKNAEILLNTDPSPEFDHMKSISNEYNQAKAC